MASARRRLRSARCGKLAATSWLKGHGGGRYRNGRGKAGGCGVVVVVCTRVSRKGGRWPIGAYLVGVLNQRSTLMPRFDGEEWAWAAVVELMIWSYI
jgi:hypothetical protein